MIVAGMWVANERGGMDCCCVDSLTMALEPSPAIAEVQYKKAAPLLRQKKPLVLTGQIESKAQKKKAPVFFDRMKARSKHSAARHLKG